MMATLKHPLLPIDLLSSLLYLGGITISLWYWSTKKRLSDSKITIAFFGVIGALLGAKVGYILAEAPIWWGDPMFWLRMLAGKTILGGLLGGWLGVEAAKYTVGETRPMGDDFARIIPVGISIGRIGCLLHGCCPGRPVEEILSSAWATRFQELGLTTWPAPAAEILFQVAFWIFCVATKNISSLKYQQFHIYLIAYGAFRVVHESLRGTVRYPESALSPYMLLGTVTAICGLAAFVWRRKQLKKMHDNDLGQASRDG